MVGAIAEHELDFSVEIIPRQTMKKIKLLGSLGKRFGREFEMEVRHPLEAIKALCCQIKGFAQYLYYASDELGVQYRVVVEDPQGRDESNLHYPMGNYDTIVIAPIASGSGGFGRILLGAVLVGLSFAVPAVGWFGVSGTTIGLMGGALILQGISQMIAPQKKTPKDREKQDSFLFDRAAEVGRQGSPVPLLIGERIIELQIVLSSGLVTNEVPI